MVSALEALEAEGRVLVVFDDRGKVMVVSEAEAGSGARGGEGGSDLAGEADGDV